jgi:hypothetical protein
LEKKSGGDRKSKNQNVQAKHFDKTKTTKLAESGIDIHTANKAEKLAKIDEGVFNDILKTGSGYFSFLLFFAGLSVLVSGFFGRPIVTSRMA